MWDQLEALPESYTIGENLQQIAHFFRARRATDGQEPSQLVWEGFVSHFIIDTDSEDEKTYASVEMEDGIFLQFEWSGLAGQLGYQG